MWFILLSILIISAFPFIGAWYARRYNKPHALIGLYVVFITLSQIMASKIAVYDLGFTIVTAPAAVLVFSVTFLMTDIVNEKFGQKQTHEMILITFLTQVAMAVFLQIGGSLQPAPFWSNQLAWDALLGVVPRIMLASWATFLVSENLDAWLYARIRKLTQGKYLWTRNIFSTIPALTVDTVLFVTLAFAGTGFPLWTLMVGQFAIKYLVGIVNIPFMYINRLILSEKPRTA